MASMAWTTAQEQAAAVTELAVELQRHISQPPDPGAFISSNDILAILDKHLDNLPLLKTNITALTRRQLDSEGTRLWNISTKLMATRGEGNESVWLAKAKALAFAMMDCVAPSHGLGNRRALNVALKTARACIENEQLGLSLKILGMAAARLETLDKSSLDTDKTHLQSATTEYYMLRIYLSWLQERPDIAEHLFSKVPNVSYETDQLIVLDICYTVGRSALLINQYDLAVKWLDRALKSTASTTQQPGVDVKDTRLLVFHAFVRANLRIKTAEAKERLFNALESLKTDYGSVFAVLVVHLEAFSREEKPDCKEYWEVIILTIRAMEFTDTNLKIVFYYIQKLKYWSVELSVKALQALLHGLAPSVNGFWVEKGFVALIWVLMTSDTCSQKSLDLIKEAVQRLDEHENGPLSEKATNAVLILVWKTIDSELFKNHISNAEQWCCFMLEQSIFQNCSSDNKAKLQRKLMACALENSNTPLARNTLGLMSEQLRSNPSTLYLMYKLAVLEGNFELRKSCHESLHHLGATGTTYLLSCAAESRRLGKPQETIRILQQIIASLNDERPDGVYIPALLQSAICLLLEELEIRKTDVRGLLEQICGVFDVALKEASRQSSSKESSAGFLAVELEWFFHRSYNTALHLLQSSSFELVISLLDLSTKFTDLYKQILSPDEQSNLSRHYLTCDFLKVIKIISEARHKTDSTEKKNYYHKIRHSIQHFRTHIQPELQKYSTATECHEWLDRYRTMLSFDFEAAVYLKQWDYLPSLVEESKPLVDDKLSSMFLDSMLSSQAPEKDIMLVVKTIICAFHASSSPFLNRASFRANLPRYLRCLFQLAISATDTALAESVVHQVLALAHQARTKSGTPYPNEELEWLATMAFNRAVDFYLGSADGDFRRWAGKAIEMADLVRDQGILGRLLRQNFVKLSGEGV
ncbi:hypothetical protein ASPWEDRAFT_175647 [Aspergillus wentii DTO 134E9]|uniref:Protein ZIP4 homolog n=1 Tax=Aspergillus wentii DTO 134E9 TaxID=1073089 RepID=A0A1L9RBR2_ASPWE|nr:uncharacterized protein ASPWEDRAFT_175647 [Aspergillus wentii DTO 134E9]OJJ32366.1 hypothetical protein ASPWEDRAFT_175647 [Aspergillus wentii DTO 134E9]